MKLVKLSTVYPVYAERFYASRPDLEGLPYRQQQDAFFADRFGFSDAWRRALAPLGYRVEEVVANVRPLQAAWTRERGRSLSREWFLETAASQVAETAPEVLFITDYSRFPAGWIRRLREDVPAIRLVMMWCGAPFDDPGPLAACDLVVTCVPELRERIRALGLACEHIHHAFDDRIIASMAGPPRRERDLTFVGQVNRQDGYHRERERLLLSLITRTPLEIYAPNPRNGLRDDLMAILRMAAYDVVRGAGALGVPESAWSSLPGMSKAARWQARPRLPVHKGLARVMRPPVFGLEMYRLLAASRISLNAHIDISPRSASNMRLFEATGAGSCLLTDARADLGTLFEPDSEVVTYRDADECMEKVRYLLDNPDIRRSVAAAGRARTLREHTYAHRAPLLDRIITARL